MFRRLASYNFDPSKNYIINKNYSSSSNIKANQLNQRSLVRCSGEEQETSQFLQGLITNDVNHFSSGSKSIYCMFLNKLGRVMYDSIIYKVKSTKPEDTLFLIECDRNVATDLSKHLKIFRIRKKIDITVMDDELELWHLFSDKGKESVDLKFSDKDDMIFGDPRLKSHGARMILPKDSSLIDVSRILGDVKIEIGSDEEYQAHRFKMGLGEGIVEILPGIILWN